MQNGAGCRLEKKDQRAADRGFARTGFPDDSKRLAATDIEVDAIDRLHAGPPIHRLKAHLKATHRDDRIRLRFGGQ